MDPDEQQASESIEPNESGPGPTRGPSSRLLRFRRLLLPHRFFARRPAATVLSIFAVLIMLLSSVGNVHASSPPVGLPGGILASAAPYYPLLINPSMYPVPDVAVTQSAGLNVSLPQLAATGIGTNPTYFLVYDLAGMQYVGTYPHGQWKFESELEVREGTFSAWLASDFLTSSSSRTLPINWSAPWNIVTDTGNCTGTSLVSSPDGSAIAAGITCAGTSTIYETSEAKVLTSWSAVGTLTGNQVRLAIDPDGFILATTITTGGHADATLIPFPSGTENTIDLGPAVQASPVIIRAVQGAVMGVAISQSNGWVSFQTSYTDPWGFGESEGIARYNETNTSTVFGSLGDTGLGTPGGSANQLQAAVVGQSVVVLSTVLIGGKMEAAVSTSPDLGVHWASPMLYPLTSGALVDPELVGTQSGYVYATWEGSGGGNLSTIDQTVFSADGRALTVSAPITGGTGPWNTSNAQVVGLAVDSFQRPLYVWATAHNQSTSNELVETGGYLPPSQIQSLEDQAVWNLTVNDFNGTGSVSTYAKGISGLLSEIVANASEASTPRYFNAARNLTADVYQNESLTSFAYFGEQTSGSGNNKKYTISGGASLTPAVKTGPGYSPPYPFGVIVPSVGFGSAGTYLGLETDWLFASEGVAATASANPVGNVSLPDSDADQLPNWDQPGYASTTVDGNLSSAVLTPTLLNPTTAEFAIAGSFPTYNYTSSSGTTSCGGHNYPTLTYFYEDKPTIFNDTPYVNSITVALPLITSSTFLSTFYLQNLSADTLINWEVVMNAAYSENETWTSRSGCTVTPHQVNLHYNVVEGPSNVNMLGAAVFSTTLSTALSVTEIGRTEVSLHWKNTMIADGASSLTPGIGSTPLTGHVIQAWGNYTGLSLQSGTEYSANVNTSSYPGGWNASWRPSDSDAEQTSSPVQNANAICQFVYVTNTISVHGLRVVSGSNNTAMVTWWANGFGFGVLEYSELGTALNQTITATISEHGNGTAQYFAVAHGLPGGAFYNLAATTTVADGPCLSLADAESTTAFLGQGFTLNPVGYAFDSITELGGGEGIFSYLSSGLLTQMTEGVISFTNGTLIYGPSNLSGPNVTIPIPSLTGIACPGDCYLENVTPSTPNASYVVQETLNFTWNHTVYSIHSSPISFTYLLDSSGDGLTNVEKLNGWQVTYTDVSGQNHIVHVTASPSLYSTNGLVGDYVEKEYGLNPRTLDSAGSHMLDTWNLTFNLGKNYPLVVPAQVQTWNETGYYNPFATSVQYSPGLFESGKPVGSSPNVTTIGPTPAGGPTSGDGSPSAATKFYASSSLEVLAGFIQFENVGWLAGVLGTFDGYHTLTVWGKLSWGADPLVASSPGDGISDGSRVNPLHTVGLYVIGLNASQTNLATGAGYAVQLAPEKPGGGFDFINYSSQAIVGNSTIPTVKNYSTVLPVPQNTQHVTLDLEVDYRAPGGNIIPIPINGSSTDVYFTYDLLGGRFVRAFTVSGTNESNGVKASLTINLQTVLEGEKAPTYLWLPTTNSTINGLPLGLTRYTGEQSFDLLVVNASASITSDAIPLPWGGTYTVNVQPGLNNFLIPREQFLDSALGEGILEGKAPAYNRSDPNPPLLGLSGVYSLISSFSGANPYVNLSAYWQNRSINTGSAGNFSNEKGVGSTNSLAVRVVAVTTPPSNNTGGLPSNPSLLNTSDANAPTAALQALVMLNVTSKARLDVLVAGLLDNSSNGVNGTFESVTNQVPFLGLDSAVTNSLANAIILSDGLSGPPQSSYPPPPPPSSGLWGDFVNAITSVVQTVAGAIITLVSVVLTVTLAAYTFIAHLAREAADIGGQLLARAASTLVSIGDAILTALLTLIDYVVTLVKNALSAVVGPIVSSAKVFDSTLGAASNATISDIANLGAVTTADGIAWAHSLDPVALLGTAVGVAVMIALTLLTPLDFGASFLFSVLLSVIPTLAQGAISGLGSVVAFTSQAVLSFENSFSDAIPSVDWRALAGAVGIAAVSLDLFSQQILLAIRGAVSGGAALVLLTSFINDFIILLISIVSWGIHLPVFAATALFFAMVGLGIALVSNFKGYTQLGAYDQVALLLSSVGVGAAAADYALAT